MDVSIRLAGFGGDTARPTESRRSLAAICTCSPTRARTARKIRDVA